MYGYDINIKIPHINDMERKIKELFCMIM